MIRYETVPNLRMQVLDNTEENMQSHMLFNEETTAQYTINDEATLVFGKD